MASLLSKRFQELAGQLAAVQATARTEWDDFDQANVQRLNDELFLNWRVKAKSLLAKACGEKSVHLNQFEEMETSSYTSAVGVAKLLRAVFEAAQEDFDGGYLTSVRTMVRAEIFDSELEQAHELLRNGYVSAAAVVAGTVLETTLRDLCDNHGLAHGKLDKMNADLTKSGEHSALDAKRITAIAAVRNAAAHGDTGSFGADDVSAMIRDIERYITDHQGK